MIHNESTNAVVLLELTCPLDSIQHLESARDQKQSKEDYLQILSELDRLGTACYYNTIGISVLGHYLQSSLSSLCNALGYIQRTTVISQSQCRKLLYEAAGLSITASRVNQTDKLYSLDSIPFLLIARTLCLCKLSYGQTQWLFGWQMSGD